MYNLNLRSKIANSSIQKGKIRKNEFKKFTFIHLFFPFFQVSEQRKSTREGFGRGGGLFGRYFWKSFPCTNPLNNQQKTKKGKTQEKLRSTYFSLIFLVFLCVDPRYWTPARKVLEQILYDRRVTGPSVRRFPTKRFIGTCGRRQKFRKWLNRD